MTKLSNAVKWFQHTDMKGSYLCTKDKCMKRDGFYGGVCDRGYWLVKCEYLDGGNYMPDEVYVYDPSNPDHGLNMTKSWFANKTVYPDVYEIVKEAVRGSHGKLNGPLEFDMDQIKWIKKQDREAFIEIKNTGIFTGIAGFSRALDILHTAKDKRGVLMAFYGDLLLLMTGKAALLLATYDPKKMTEYRKRVYKLSVYNVGEKKKEGKVDD